MLANSTGAAQWSSLSALLELNDPGPGAGRSQMHQAGSKPEGRRDSSIGLPIFNSQAPQRESMRQVPKK